jgi:endonuclease-3
MVQNKHRREKVLEILEKTYPKATIALNYTNSLELLIAVILSAQCTDVMVNKVTEKLFKKYKTLADYCNADIKEFEQDIKSTGFYHAKAKNILETVKIIKEKFNGEVPKTMEDLTTLKGVARKTANIVLGNAYKIVVGIPVDTHVGRLSQRLRLVDMSKIGGKKEFTFKKNGKDSLDFKKDADPVKIEKDLMGWVSKSKWLRISYELIDHGRAICKAQNPKCEMCPLSSVCPTSRV